MWRMVWQVNSTVIVMVTNVREGSKKKSEKYWPDLNNVSSYGSITVLNVEEQDHDNYVIRKFQLQMGETTDEIHIVWHYHFTSWPDKSVPSAVTPLIKFIEKFKYEKNTALPTSGPVIVHCSAGAGRTGTVIAISAMLDMAKQKGQVDVFNFVRSMREKRIQMVQTEEQYRFIYEVLLEVLFCGQTAIPVMDLDQILRKDAEKYSITRQLMTLNSLSPQPREALVSVGMIAKTSNRNRFPDVIPLDRSRLHLMTSSINENNYINASFCDGYSPNAFIATQSPLMVPDTSADFWSMVFDYECHIMVTLNELEDKSYAKFIPVNGQLPCGQYIVNLEASKQNHAVIEQKLILHKGKAKRELFHFIYTQWKMGERVPDMDSFLHLISTVERRQRSCKGFTSIIICQDGARRCGLYCAVSSIIKKIQEETLVDVYQTVKRLRKSCPHMVNTMEQYTFCYDAAVRILDGSQSYENVNT